MPAKKDAKAAIKAVIYDNPTWTDERVWAELKAAGHEPSDKHFISATRDEMGAKHTWAKPKKET
jgi:hypothetical protein